MADISLLFDVAMGGGNPSGDSEQLIRSQLEAIVNGINAKPFSIKFQADEASLQQFQKRVSEIAISLGNGAGTSSAAFEQVTRQINIAATAIHTMNGAVNASNLERISTALSGLAGANISDGAIADIVSRLESMSVVLTDARIQFEDLGKTGERVPRLIIEGVDAAGNAIRRNLRFDNKGELERDLTDITVKLAEVEKASKGSGTSTKSAGEKATDAFARAKKAVTDYYNALTQLERSGLRNVITQGADGTWSSSQSGYAERVAQLNRLTQEYHNATAARQTFTASQQAEFTEHETARAQQYRVAVEDVARAERQRQETLRSTVTITRSYDNTIADCQKKLKDWSAAENSRHQSSRAAYDALRNEVTAAELARVQYNNGEISIKQYTAAMDRLKSTLISTKTTLQQNGDAAKTLGERLAGLAKKFASWFGVSQTIMYTYRSIRKMVTSVIELDTAMTELKKVTDETDATYDKFLRNAATRAKRLGASLTDVVKTSADFARLGLSLGDAETVSDAALVYKNVGDGIEDIDHASESLISTMQAFGIEAEDVMSIVDKFNVTGNKFAISSGGIGDALLNSAAALDAAGNTLDESIALITAANTTIQNPEKVGTALKTISMYLRAAKTEAEEAGESTEGMADSVSELRDELLSLTGGRVDIQIDEDTFKSTYQILNDLSEVWGDLSDISQANITELIGGKRNANVISALLQDFEIAEDVISKTATASGSALEENSKVLESIRGKINVFKATFQEFSNNFIGSDLVKGVVDLGTFLLKILGAIPALTNALGGLSNVLFTIAGIMLTIRAERIWTRITKIGYSIKNLTFLTGVFGTTFRACFDAARVDGAHSLRAALVGLKGGFSGVVDSATKAQIAVASFFAIVAGVRLIAKLYDAFTVSLAESRKELANLKEEYNENENELTTLNDELQTTIDRINELQGKESLTFTEAEELDNLRRQNAELERQIALLETLQKQNIKETNQAFVRTMEKDLNVATEKKSNHKFASPNYVPTPGSTDSAGGPNNTVITMTEREFLNSALMRYNELYAEWQNASGKNKAKIEKDLDDIQKYLTNKVSDLSSYAEGISYINNPTTDDEKAVNEWLDFINDFTDRMMIATGQSKAKENAFNRLIYGGFSDATSELKNLGEQGEVTAEHLEDSRYDAFIQKCIELGIIADDSEGSLEFLASGFNLLSGTVSDSKEKIDEHTTATSKFASALSKINKLSDDLGKLGSIYADIYDKEDFDWNIILGNEDFTNAFGGLGDAYDDFIKTVANAPDDISACQDAFDRLATSYILNSDALGSVTDETRNATVAMLEQMGVANAATLVDEHLALNKETARLQSELQADATHKEVLALYDEETATRITAQAIFELAIAKIQTNENAIVTSSEIDQLEGLAKSANATEASLLRVAQAKALMTKAEMFDLTAEAWRIIPGFNNTYLSYVEQAEAARKEAQELLSRPLEYNEIDFSKYITNSGNKSGSGSSKEETWFEKQLSMHQHLVAMNQETQEEYLTWLNSAYKKAYDEGIIDLNDYYKYTEEVYQGLQDLFRDYLSDVEHEISMRENYDGEARKIIELYEGLIKKVEKEIADARARGLTDEDDYIQELQKKWQDYTGSIEDLRDEITESAKDALDELIDYRVDMLKQEIEDEKDALDERLDNLKEFYDKQKEMLQDQRDEENYLKDQSDKRKTVTDLQAELAMLANDDSAWAQKRKLELQEEITTAQEDLDEFEKDHALDLAIDALDKAYNDQEAQLQAEMDALEERLNDPEALYNKALEDIRKNSENQLYYQMLMYNRRYGDGNDETVKDLWESAFGALSDYEKLFGELYKGVGLENETGVEDEGGWNDETISGTNPDNQQPITNPSGSTTTETPKSYPYGKASESSGNISKGSTGTKVKAIQYALNELGFGNSGTADCDGVFGNGTQSAVMAFQSAMGISVDGIVGKDTRDKFKAQGYAVGTSSATPGIHAVDELGTEYIFESPSDGTRYRMFHGGEKVLTADATDFLYQFANSGGSILTKMISDLFRLSSFGNISKPVQAIEVNSGDIIVQGNASERTVSEIRRAQRENLEFVLKSLNSLNK